MPSPPAARARLLERKKIDGDGQAKTKIEIPLASSAIRDFEVVGLHRLKYGDVLRLNGWGSTACPRCDPRNRARSNHGDAQYEVRVGFIGRLAYSAFIVIVGIMFF